MNAQLTTPGRTATARRGWRGDALAAVLICVAASAVYGGAGLIVNGMGMPADWLDGTPFSTWTLPGAALLVTVALPQAGAAGAVLAGRRWAAQAGLIAGAGLMLWILVQVLVLRRYFFLQPVIAGLGATELLLAWRWMVVSSRA